jgi:hypothetical protein
VDSKRKHLADQQLHANHQGMNEVASGALAVISESPS